MANRDWRLRVYDRNTPDYDAFQQFDQEAIEISSPPIWIYQFNVADTFKDKVSGIDELLNETDMLDEDKIMSLYAEGFDEEFTPDMVKDGEKFYPPKETVGFYQEPAWTQELTRFGFEDVTEELAITFNYRKMLADVGREIKRGDVIKTFRNKIYRVSSAYIADETVGWKYIHFHVIAIKAKNVDYLDLPDDPDVPVNNSAGGI
jgi:hypothetical protein